MLRSVVLKNSYKKRNFVMYTHTHNGLTIIPRRKKLSLRLTIIITNNSSTKNDQKFKLIKFHAVIKQMTDSLGMYATIFLYLWLSCHFLRMFFIIFLLRNNDFFPTFPPLLFMIAFHPYPACKVTSIIQRNDGKLLNKVKRRIKNRKIL